MTTTETEVLPPPLLDCEQGKNPPHQNEVVSRRKTGDSNEGVASDRIRENGNGVKNVSKNNNGGMQGEAYHTTDSTNNREGDARETTTVEKSTHGAQNPNLNKEPVPPSDTSLPQRGDQLPASELTPPTNRAHSPLSEEEASNGHNTPPLADIHSRACQQCLGTHDISGRHKIPIKSTLVPCPIMRETMTATKIKEPLEGLQPPVLEATGSLVTGSDTDKLRLQNKQRRHQLQDQQSSQESYWTTHSGTAVLPHKGQRLDTYLNEMCPAGISMSHPAGALLVEWATMGCPTKTGRPWTKKEIWEAVERGPHQSALSPEALTHFAEESVEKVKAGQANLVLWDHIKDNPPTQLKIPPIPSILTCHVHPAASSPSLGYCQLTVK
jgi:hypothetical protein